MRLGIGIVQLASNDLMKSSPPSVGRICLLKAVWQNNCWLPSDWLDSLNWVIDRIDDCRLMLGVGWSSVFELIRYLQSLYLQLCRLLFLDIEFSNENKVLSGARTVGLNKSGAPNKTIKVCFGIKRDNVAHNYKRKYFNSLM